jgi:regulator of sigma D
MTKYIVIERKIEHVFYDGSVFIVDRDLEYLTDRIMLISEIEGIIESDYEKYDKIYGINKVNGQDIIEFLDYDYRDVIKNGNYTKYMINRSLSDEFEEVYYIRVYEEEA